MQKKILVAAVAAMCAAIAAPALAQQSAPSKVELWGIVDAGIRHTNNQGATRGNKTEMVGGGMSESRWGIKVTENMGGGTSALVELENRFKADTGEVPGSYPFFQLAFVGLQGPYGRLTMGRQWNVLFDVVSSTYASFPYSPYMDAYKPELGMAAGARTSNSLKYAFANADRSFAGALQYSFAEGNDTRRLESGALAQVGAATAALPVGPGGALVNVPLPTAYGLAPGLVGPGIRAQITGAPPSAEGVSVATGALKTMGGFLRYSKSGISVGGGFLRTELPGGSDLDAWTLGGSYRSGPLYLNLGYGLNKIKRNTVPADYDGFVRNTVRNQVDQQILNGMWGGQTNGGFQAGDAEKRQMIKVGFGYQITPQINAGMHYFHAKQSGGASGQYNGKANFMVAAVDYAFSKRTDAYAAVDHTKVSGGAAMAIDSLANTGGVAVRSRTGITVGLRHRF